MQRYKAGKSIGSISTVTDIHRWQTLEDSVSTVVPQDLIFSTLGIISFIAVQ